MFVKVWGPFTAFVSDEEWVLPDESVYVESKL